MKKSPKSSRRRPRDKNARKAISAAQLEARAPELKAAGLTFREIATTQGVHHSAVESAYYRALNGISEPDAREERNLSMERIRAMRAALWVRFDGHGEQACPTCGLSKDMLQAAAPLLRLEERQSKLLGWTRRLNSTFS